MKGLRRLAFCLWIILSSASVIRADDEHPQLVSFDRVISTMAESRTITLSSYTLSPYSRIGAALLTAARRGAVVSLVLDGDGLASANRSNREAVTVFAANNIHVRLTNYKLHIKAVIIDDKAVFVSDRNWTASSSSVIMALPKATASQVKLAIYNRPSSNETFATRKRDALMLEARLLSQRRSNFVLVETESFSKSSISTIIERRARAGDNVILVVAVSEYRLVRRERRDLQDLLRAGVHVFVATSNEKIAVDGDAVFTGSANMTSGWEEQIDWGIVLANPDIASELGRHVRENAANGTELQLPAFAR